MIFEFLIRIDDLLVIGMSTADLPSFERIVRTMICFDRLIYMNVSAVNELSSQRPVVEKSPERMLCLETY